MDNAEILRLEKMIEKERFEDPAKELEIARMLIDELEGTDETFHQGYAYLSAGEACFMLGDTERGIGYMNVAEEKLRDNLSNNYGIDHLLDVWGVTDMLTGPNEKAGSILNRSMNILLQIAEIADTDALTGLPNVREMNDIMDRYFHNSERHNTQIAFEMLDIDHFKKFNDTYGHDVGDLYLKALANSLIEMTEQFNADRPDIYPISIAEHTPKKEVRAARRGGDEFAVFYYGLTDKELHACGERIAKNYQKFVKSANVPEISTVSQGIISCHASDFERPSDILRVADNALYYVKEHGNDGVLLVHGQTELDRMK